MPRYSSNPQYPGTNFTPFNPEQISLIKVAESIIIGARSKDIELRDTCREFIGYEVPREKPLPEGYYLCTECLNVKHRREFTADSRKVNGLQSHCKECERQRQKRVRIRRAQMYRKSA